MAKMTQDIRFYVSDDGHVLDNREHPVQSPEYSRPVLKERLRVMEGPVPPDTLNVEIIRYRAYHIRRP